ncbi:hypothetical protein GGR54DRAFT_163296 [Hypoxylon sp. NC1633]|nr:hypothetical protein GGR54DRAFT_163296 [Hypoxylon sp. NC1633]
MKGSRSICLLCRHLISAAGRSRTSQWQAQAARFATTRSPQRDDLSVERTTQTSEEPLIAETAINRPKLDKVRRVVNDNQRRTSGISWSRKGPGKAPTKNSARTDALFKEIVREQTSRKDVPASTDSKSNNMDLALVQAIANLERMIEKGNPEADAYAYLQTVVYPILPGPNVAVPRIFYRVVSRLMEKIVSAKKEAIRFTKLPTVADIFRVHRDIGEMNPQRWAMLVGELVKAIVETGHSSEEQQPDAVDENLATRDAMLTELVESWKVLSMPKVMPVAPDNELTDGFWFPRLVKYSLRKFEDTGNFPAAFSSVFPDYRPVQLGAPVAVLAIATYALLLDPQRSNPDVRQSATRFVTRVGNLIKFVKYRDKALQSHLAHNFPGLENYVMSQWPNIKEYLKDKFESMAGSATPREPSKPSHLPSPVYKSLLSQLNRVHELKRFHGTRSRQHVDELWQKFVGSHQDIAPNKAAELRNQPGIFDLFISVRMALNQPDQAIAALATLRQVGLKPTLRTWTSMLDGCKKARNVNAIRNVWAKLAGSGLKLDMRLWTARVSGLIEGGDVQGGIQALEEMTRLWNESSKDENSTAVKPTIEPVNAALVCLVRQDEVSAAENLLVWAGRQGIEPDIFTFNALLSRFISDGRNNRDRDVRRLFALMKDTGVDADETTFTIILNASMSKISPGDTESQAKVVAGVLDDMQAAGLEANLRTYGKMISNLLQSSKDSDNDNDHAMEALKAVLAHLWDHGHELSPHIYTMLVKGYFTRHPPDLEAVDALLQRRRLLDCEDFDKVFWDTVIKGYLRAGQVSKALEITYRLGDAGAVIVLSTQEGLLQALLQHGREADATALVAKLRSVFEKGHRLGGYGSDELEQAVFWRHPFWRAAEMAGVFERNSIGIATDAAVPAAGSESS